VPRERLGVAVHSEVRRLPVARERLVEAARAVLRAEGVRDALVSLSIVEPTTSARMNRAYLGHRGPTDVITFALDAVGPIATVGDIYICLDVVRMHARRYRIPLGVELMRVVVHGALHVVGHTHPEGEGRETSTMWRRQERLLARLLARMER
jgi:probable rRNA maturation factor